MTPHGDPQADRPAPEDPSPAGRERSGALTRRALLRAATGSAGAALGAVLAEPAEAAADPVLHLVRRATYGPTPALMSEVRRLGATAWLEQQLAPQLLTDTAMNTLAARWSSLRLTAGQVKALPAAQVSQVMNDLVQVHVARACWSRRQLLEVMVDFWSNHLNATCPSADVRFWRHLYDRDVIRRHALGRFSDMLVASARHPAMLQYLDNALSSGASSSGARCNENYGRELLELHTVGRDGGYVESEVRQSALLLTGLSINYATATYEYRPRQRYVGPLQVLGFSSANASAEAGEGVALAYVRYLASHPSTARRLAHKLAVRFVSDNPPAALVDRLASVYLANATAIAPVLRTLFTSPEFAASTGQKVRRPFEDVVATVRVLGIGPDRTGTTGVRMLEWMARRAGHAPLGWPAPDGYPDDAAAFAGAGNMLFRWNAHMSLAASSSPSTLVYPPVRSLLGGVLPATWGAAADRLAARLYVGPLTAGQRTAICAYVSATPAARLAGTTAGIDWRLRRIVVLLLNTPQFMAR